MDVFAHCADVVRTGDRNRYLADLFAPEALRPHLFALHAFDFEVGRVRGIVSEPTLGEIRLQWWLDAIGGDAGGHPVATALNETIATFQLPIDAFARLLEARGADLYDDPPASLNDLEGYAGDTVSAVFQLGAIILAGGADPGTADISGHAGVALGLTRLLKALPRHAARGQSFLPADRAAAHGVEMADYYRGQASAGLQTLLGELRGAARDHLGRARAGFGAIKPAVRPAFLPLATVGAELDRMGRADYDPFRTTVDLAPWRQQWRIWRAARRGL